MTQIKSRNWTKQEDEDLLTILSELEEKQQEATWNQIAQLMKQRNPGSRKTGKQCRQRWANQLDPRIKRSENWTKEENQTLFKLHLSLGNKWSEISSHIPGRTDNCVKNHFYSTMRRGMRKINSYIQNVKRRTTLAKTFKNQILNKILTLCEGKNDDKFQFNQAAKQLALSIKTNLVKLSLQLSDIDQQNSNFKQEIFQQISQFSRNCRKRKAKKSCQISNNYQVNLEDKSFSKNYMNVIKQNKLIEAINNKQKNKKLKLRDDDDKIIGIQPKAIKVPLYQIKAPDQSSNKQRLTNNQKKIFKLQKQQPMQDQNRMNPFSCIFANPQFFNFYPTRTQITQASEKQIKPHNQDRNQGFHMGFLSTLPDISKNAQENNFNIASMDKKNDIGVIDFSNFPVAPQLQVKQSVKQKINGIFPEMIKSQELSQSFNYSYAFPNKQNPISPINSGIDLNMGIAFSPSFSPFSIYGTASGFNYFANWPVQQQKFRSTRFQSQNYDEKQKQSQISIQGTLIKKNSKEQNPQQDNKPLIQGQN